MNRIEGAPRPPLSRRLTSAAVLSLGCSLGCTAISREVRIEAAPDVVWGQAANFEKYGEWNPFFTSIEGKLAPGEKVRVTMQPVGKKKQSFSPKILSVEPGTGWVWRGRLGIPGLFDGRHTFTMQRTGDGAVVFRQEERFSGILVPFVGFRPYIQGWERMNEALAERAEGASEKRPSGAP